MRARDVGSRKTDVSAYWRPRTGFKVHSYRSVSRLGHHREPCVDQAQGVECGHGQSKLTRRNVGFADVDPDKPAAAPADRILAESPHGRYREPRAALDHDEVRSRDRVD